MLALLLLASVVDSVEREVSQGCELRFDAVQPGRVRWRLGDLEVVRLA